MFDPCIAHQFDPNLTQIGSKSLKAASKLPFCFFAFLYQAGQYLQALRCQAAKLTLGFEATRL
jgi:hypothetical protein